MMPSHRFALLLIITTPAERILGLFNVAEVQHANKS